MYKESYSVLYNMYYARHALVKFLVIVALES